MRAVTRLRSLRVRSYVMPLLLAALALRVLIPRIHAGGDGAPALRVVHVLDRPGRSEIIECRASRRSRTANTAVRRRWARRSRLSTSRASPPSKSPCLPRLDSQIPKLRSLARNPASTSARLTSGSAGTLVSPTTHAPACVV